MKIFRVVIPICVMLLAWTPGQAADDAPETAVKDAAKVEAGRVQAAVEAEAPAMSPAAASSESAADALVTSAGFTAMAPGVCLVIEDLVNQFCSQNPSDVSCQYR